MRKKLVILGLILIFGVGLALTIQAKEIATFKNEKLGQLETIKVASIQEGARGGDPVIVEDHLRVMDFLYVDKGIVSGKSGGDPVIIGDHLRVDGWLFANAGIVNGEPGGSPVIIADHLRVDGEISRDAGSVKIKDSLTVTETTSLPGVTFFKTLAIFSSDLHVSDLDATGNISASGNLSVSKNSTVWGNSTVYGKMDVSGNSSFHKDLDVRGKLDASLCSKLIIPTKYTSCSGYCYTVGELFIATAGSDTLCVCTSEGYKASSL